LRGEDSIAELCRREGIVQNLYYRWSKEFLEAGKKRLAGDTAWLAVSIVYIAGVMGLRPDIAVKLAAAAGSRRSAMSSPVLERIGLLRFLPILRMGITCDMVRPTARFMYWH
jgi:transposase-like protein